MPGLKTVLAAILGIVIVGILAAYILAGWNERPMDDDARASAPGAFLETSQGRIHYQWFGEADAPTIVMVHGFSTPSFIYEQNATALAAAGFRVLTFDHFGRGWSDRPRTSYDDQFYERELLDVLDGLAIREPIGLVGLSMGGLTTSYFAGRHPDRIAALFLFVPAGLDLSADPESVSSRLLMTPIIGDWIWRVFGKSILLGDPQYDESDLEPGNRLQGDVAEQMQFEGYMPALLSTYRNMQMHSRDEVFQALRSTGIPVTALFGSADPTVLNTSLARLDRALPTANTVMIEGGAHGLSYQMHEQANANLIEFFEAHLEQ
jgi:pimeloyl-ACP methyl ester carboxylesterase